MTQFVIVLDFFGHRRVYSVWANDEDEAKRAAKLASYNDPQEEVIFCEEVAVTKTRSVYAEFLNPLPRF